MNICFKNPFLYNGRVSAFANVMLLNRSRRKYMSDNVSSGSIQMSYNKYDNFRTESSSLKSPLIIMHGLFGSKTNWQSVSKVLNKTLGRTIYAVDARNHGNSPHTDDFSYELLGGDIKQMVDSISVDKVCLMGHSMGGRAAMYFSLKFPKYLEKLIVVDISPYSSTTNMSSMIDFFKIMRSVKIDPTVSTGEARKIASEQMLKHIHSKLVVDFLLTNLIKSPDGTFKWRINLDSLEKHFQKGVMNFPETSEVFEKPTLFIAGLQSDYLTPDHEEKILKKFPQSNFVYLNTGHWVHAEDPSGLIAAVNDFLK